MTLDRVESDIAALEALPPGWDSYGGLPPAPAAIAAAHSLTFALHLAGRLDGLSPSVVPGAAGQVQLEWHASGMDLEIEFDADGGCAYLLTVDGEDYEGRVPAGWAADIAGVFISSAESRRILTGAP